MTGYLKRLVSSLAAYQVADVASKFIAVLLLPVYTRYISPAGYGVVELLANGVILISILVRFGMIESFLRFYFSDEDQRRRDALARRTAGFLLLTTTVASVALALAAAPLSKVVLGYRDPTTFRIAVLGLWAFTNLELAYAMLRVEERLRTYAVASLTNVALTVASSLVLVVVLGKGARGLLLGNYGASTLVLLGLWWTMRDRLLPRHPSAEGHSVLLRFGLPTVPAEVSVYALSIIDRYYLFHHRSPGLAGLYSIAVKLAGAVAFIVRAFQYAWPPLAYSVRDDAEAARLYGLVTTYYLLVSGLVVAGLALLGRWVLRLLVAPVVLRGLPGPALGGAGLGAVRAVGGVPGHRRAGQRDHAQLPGSPGRPGGQRRPAPGPGAGTRDRRRGHRAVRGVRGDDRGHAPADSPGVRRGVRMATAGPAGLGRAAGWRPPAMLLLPTRGAVGFLARAAVLAAIPVGPARHRVRSPAGARAGAAAARRRRAEEGECWRGDPA